MATQTVGKHYGVVHYLEEIVRLYLTPSLVPRPPSWEVGIWLYLRIELSFTDGLRYCLLWNFTFGRQTAFWTSQLCLQVDLYLRHTWFWSPRSQCGHNSAPFQLDSVLGVGMAFQSGQNCQQFSWSKPVPISWSNTYFYGQKLSFLLSKLIF